MKKAKWILTLALGALVSCVTAQLATPDSDAAAKKFQPPEGKANLYVARSGSSFGETTFKVVVDGKTVGAVSPGTFVLVELSPGTHNVAAASVETSSKVSLNAEAGKNYFYEVTAKAGDYTARPTLSVVLLEVMGKMMVQQNKRSQSMDQ